MVGIPTFILVFFVVRADGRLDRPLVHELERHRRPRPRSSSSGSRTTQILVTVYPPFWPALTHNLIWLGFFLFIATPLGIFFAVLLDKNIRGTRFYQSALYLPVVLSLAIVGFIWQLQYSPDAGAHQQRPRDRTGRATIIDWLGDPNLNLWAVLIAASWRQVGYVMILYLAGLKAVDPSAPGGRPDRRRQRAPDVLPGRLPGDAPDQHRRSWSSRSSSRCARSTSRTSSTRASTAWSCCPSLVTNNIIGETSRVGFGSAIAVVLLVVSVGPIICFLSRALREDARDEHDRAPRRSRPRT